ncbi:hypothetical protein LV777_10425 [Providencia rettgeri]|uniref:hypothetical protein n=1 Tax=Providencia rettgeri TaxID=587 RepID=UPI0020540F06|nr:hypothetical protein [Providencia rettgeri]UPQ37757.1 hypothetical protein LV777_10425 [Providencia rettgeri]
MQDLMPPINTQDSIFHDGDPTTGQLGTIVTASWLNNVQAATRDVQAEIKNVLAKAGMTPDPKKNNQLADAISQIVTSGNYASTAYVDNGLNKKIDKANISSVLGNDNSKVPSLGLLTIELGKKQPAGNYQPSGDYATNKALNDGLSNKFDKDNISQGTGSSTVHAMSQDASTKIFQPKGDYLKVGSFGFGGEAVNVPNDTGYNGITQTSVIKGSGVLGTPDGDLAWGAILHLQREQGRATQIGFWKGNIGLRSQLAGAWDADWIFAYTQANTSKDPSGFVRASGSAVALTTNNVMQGAGSSTANIMSQKAVTDLLVGYGQDWVNVTAERKFGVTYRNTSNKQIFVSVTQNSSTSTTSMEVLVNGRLVAKPSTSGGGATRNCVYFPVMPGQEYIINATGTNSIEVWAEAK